MVALEIYLFQKVAVVVVALSQVASFLSSKVCRGFCVCAFFCSTFFWIHTYSKHAIVQLLEEVEPRETSCPSRPPEIIFESQRRYTWSEMGLLLGDRKMSGHLRGEPWKGKLFPFIIFATTLARQK